MIRVACCFAVLTCVCCAHLNHDVEMFHAPLSDSFTYRVNISSSFGLIAVSGVNLYISSLVATEVGSNVVSSTILVISSLVIVAKCARLMYMYTKRKIHKRNVSKQLGKDIGGAVAQHAAVVIPADHSAVDDKQIQLEQWVENPVMNSIDANLK